MNVTAKRNDIFMPPVLINVLGWHGESLKQIRCGLTAQATRRPLPRPANDQ